MIKGDFGYDLKLLNEKIVCFVYYFFLRVLEIKL